MLFSEQESKKKENEYNDTGKESEIVIFFMNIQSKAFIVRRVWEY